MQNKGTQDGLEIVKRVIRGNLIHKNYELQFISANGLDAIHLTQFEFELLVDNEEGQIQLMKKNGGTELVDLVATFRNEEQTTFNIYFNSKTVKVNNFTKEIDDLEFIKNADYKKVYRLFL